MGKAATIDELKAQINREVFSEFSGMDNEYESIVSNYKKIHADRGTYTADYIQKKRFEAVADITRLKAKYSEKAFQKLDNIADAHTVRKDPQPEPKDTQERLLFEIQRSNNLKLFEAKLKAADIETIKELYDEHKNDEDFLTMLNTIDLSETDQNKLNLHIEQSKHNPFLDEIERMKYSLNSLVKNSMFPESLENGLEGVNFRSIEEDFKPVKVF